MTKYPAAERIALDLILFDDDLRGHVAEWSMVYTARLGREPSGAEVEAARGLLAQRLDGVAPSIPPSASSTALRFPRVEFGIPGGDDGSTAPDE